MPANPARLPALAVMAALLATAAPAAAVDKIVPPRVAPLFLVRDAVAPDAAPREVDYGQLLTVQTVDAAPGLRLLDTYRAPIGLVLVPAGAVLVAVREARGGTLWCYTPPSSIWIGEGQRWCFGDADGDGRFDQIFSTFLERGSSRIAYAGMLTAVRAKPLRYERMSEPPTAPEVLALRYVGPTEGEVVDGRLVHGVIELELMLGPDRVHLSKLATMRVRLDGGGAGRARGPLGIEIAVERAGDDGRTRLQVLATAPTGEGSL
jgi:hypothetical protein